METQSPDTDRSEILILAPQPFFQERGTPIAVRLLTEELADAGYKVDLLTYHEGLPFVYQGVSLHRTCSLPGLSGLKPGFSLKKIACDVLMLCKSISLIRKNQYRVLHAVEESVFTALLLSVLFSIPFIYDMDSLLSLQLTDMFPLMGRCSGVLQWFEKKAMRRSKGIIAVCETLRETALRAAPSVPVAVLEDVSLIDSADEDHPDDDIRRNSQIKGCLVMYVGNLEKYQGIDLLLESYTLLPQEQREKMSLVIIGGREEDIAKYTQKSTALGIKGRVHFLGQKPVKYLGYYLRQADILVSPRIQGNNTPMKLYSYLASGRPVIATNLPTHTQVLDDRIALLSEPEPAAFMAALQTLGTNEALRQQLGLAGAQRAEERYSREAYRAKLRRFYLDTIGPPA